MTSRRLALIAILVLAWRADRDLVGQADPFADDIVRSSALTVRPKVLEKREPPPGAPGESGPVGDLQIDFVVERDGTVRFARVAADAGAYRSALANLIAHLKRWKFSPGLKDGGAVRTLARLTVSYVPRGRRAGGPALAGVGMWSIVDGADDDFGAGAVKFGESGVQWTSVKKDAMPQYPDALRRERMSGLVSLELLVELDGHVSAVRVVSSTDERFEPNALKCAREWLFKPAMKDGKAVRALVDLVLEFKMH